MSERFYLNDNWTFKPENGPEATVRLPHTVKVTPFNYFDESIYQFISEYKRSLFVKKEWEGMCLRLKFEGVAHKATVYINNVQVAENNCGYTEFIVDITDRVRYGEANELKVIVDSNETLNQPPFGFVIDYMTYGGIYREVSLEVSDKAYIADMFLRYEEGKLAVDITSTYPGETDIYIDDKLLGSARGKQTAYFEVGDITLWDLDNPKLYNVTAVLKVDGVKTDVKTERFGFRTIEFKADGFYLNGNKVKLRGLNRHQSYPYVGYAMPESVQRDDAYTLKKELGLNAVRTSHYPDSHHFYDACDELGLLVFTEIPGWQHIGDEDWKNIAVLNTIRMITSLRNHPSIILWGVRINESVDDDSFYKRTNAAAHEADPSRPTGGVRAFKKSSFLEDVYTYNDFLHDGKHKGCDAKKAVTSDMKRAYLISEYNGHMYPTKAFDWEEHRREHAIRHANVLNEVSRQSDIAGSFGWCMADYNTHKDFGSGDRICYHGVLDMFRNPKLAAYVYAALGSKEPVLKISSSMDIGEHPGCNRGDTFIFTNCDSVKMYKNDHFIKEYVPTDSEYKYLSHGPIKIDDYIGDAIHKGENFKPKQAKLAKELLNATAIYGLSNLPKSIWVKAAWMMVRYHMNFGDAVTLYNKYVGDWGGKATVYRFEGIKDGKVVIVDTAGPLTSVRLEADSIRSKLIEGDTYDVGSIRIRALDEHGNVVNFFNEPVCVSVEGPGEIIGEDVISLKGGLGGVYVKTLKSGRTDDTITVNITSKQYGNAQVSFRLENKGEEDGTI